MNKDDAPRLKKFLGSLMRMKLGDMHGKEMVELVRNMEWLASEADKLGASNEGIKVKSTSPIDKDSD